MEMLNDIRRQMEKAIEQAKYLRETSACTTYNTNDGWIDIWMDSHGNSEVVICQDADNDRQHPNLEDAIFNTLPEWDDVEIDMDEPHSDYVRFYNRI